MNQITKIGVKIVAGLFSLGVGVFLSKEGKEDAVEFFNNNKSKENE